MEPTWTGANPKPEIQPAALVTDEDTVGGNAPAVYFWQLAAKCKLAQITYEFEPHSFALN